MGVILTFGIYCNDVISSLEVNKILDGFSPLSIHKDFEIIH